MSCPTPGRRAKACGPILVLALLTLTAAAPRAVAQGVPWPFLPHATDFRFLPVQPDDANPVQLVLSSAMPFRCGEVVDAHVLDPGHVALTLRPGSECPDSAAWRTYEQWFDLGMRPIGMHEVSVHVRVEWPDRAATEEDGVIPYEVVHATPPPGPDSTLGTIFLWAQVDPTAPGPDDPIQVTVFGRFPYACGEIVDPGVGGDHSMHLTVRRRESCTDTARTWRQVFELGVLPAGPHPLWVRASIEGDPDRTADSLLTSVVVIDPDQPPPSPLDTLTIRLASAPAHPRDTEPVTVVARGFYPYSCGEVVGAGLVDAEHLQLTLRPTSDCPIPGAGWEHVFEIGVLPSGRHVIQLEARIEDSSGTTVRLVTDTVDVGGPPEVPGDSLLAGLSVGRPNPFRDESRFSVSLDRPAVVDVAVYDLAGRRVTTVFRGPLAAGVSELRWNGRRSDGAWATSGIYFYRLRLADRVVSRRVVLLARP